MKKRRRRRPLHHPGVVPPVTTAPNDLWAADFKGHFRTGDRRYCYPLTVTVRAFGGVRLPDIRLVSAAYYAFC